MIFESLVCWPGLDVSDLAAGTRIVILWHKQNSIVFKLPLFKKQESFSGYVNVNAALDVPCYIYNVCFQIILLLRLMNGEIKEMFIFLESLFMKPMNICVNLF